MVVGLRHHRLEAALHVWRHLIDGNDNGYGWVFLHTSGDCGDKVKN